VPVFIGLLVTAEGGHSWPAAIVFGVAAITDQIDGWLARRLEVESEFGKYADPLADRLMIDVAVLLLVVADRLPWPAFVLIIARDALLIVGARVAIPRGYEFSVSFLGKLATWVLYAGIAFILVTHEGNRWPLVIFWTGLGLAVAAGVLYVASAWREVRR
jgi:CDP-diacylglycerol--glycerol-3-phosphate 3-phosphatidyltransferase